MEPNRQERHEAGATSVPHEDFVRLPGLYRRWELEQVVDAGADFHLEEAGVGGRVEPRNPEPGRDRQKVASVGTAG
jgi:hypothetical protein